jgi:hypothetical protein
MLLPDDHEEKLITSLGDISGVELFHNQVMLAVYVRPTQTRGGLHLPSSHVDEDKIQGKVGLLVKKGPDAFVSDGNWFNDMDFTVGKDWLLFRPSDGWSVTVNGVICRIFDDILIRGRLPHPDAIW